MGWEGGQANQFHFDVPRGTIASTWQAANQCISAASTSRPAWSAPWASSVSIPASFLPHERTVYVRYQASCALQQVSRRAPPPWLSAPATMLRHGTLFTQLLHLHVPCHTPLGYRTLWKCSFPSLALPHHTPSRSTRSAYSAHPSSPPHLSLSPLHSPCHQKGLAGVSMLLVNQKVEYMEALTGFETANQYTVLNEHGHPTFHAAEVSNWMSRNFLGKNRPFTLNVVNPDGSPFLVIDRVRPPRPAYTVTFGALLQCTFAFPRTSVTYMYVILFRVPLALPHY